MIGHGLWERSPPLRIGMTSGEATTPRQPRAQPWIWRSHSGAREICGAERYLVECVRYWQGRHDIHDLFH